MYADVPVPFSGTPEQRDANFRSHHFAWSNDPDEAGDARCYDCDCRPSHVSANYPCGVEPPRMRV
jgi:hypothetical protein